MTNTILAIDPGKFNSVLCHFDPDTRGVSFRTVEGRLVRAGRVSDVCCVRWKRLLPTAMLERR